MELQTIVEAVPALNALNTQPLPARTAYLIAKLIRTAQAELADYNSVRRSLFDRYGEPAEEGMIRIPQENADAFEAEHQALLDSEVEINPPRLSLDELKDAKLTPAQIAALDFLFEPEAILPPAFDAES